MTPALPDDIEAGIIFEQGGDPLCVDWLNLPCTPSEILARGKKITHIVKRWQNMDQKSIREYFKDKRKQNLSEY